MPWDLWWQIVLLEVLTGILIIVIKGADSGKKDQ